MLLLLLVRHCSVVNVGIFKISTHKYYECVLGHESSSFHPLSRPPAGPSTSTGKSWSEHSSLTHKFGDSSSMHDMRPKHLKKTTQYQPPPWDPPVHSKMNYVNIQFLGAQDCLVLN